MIIGYHGSLDPSYGTVVRVFPNGQPVAAVDATAKLRDNVKAAFDPIISAGQVPFGSFKIPLDYLTGTNYDSDIDTLGTYLSSLTVKPYLTVWHEPENDMTGAQYKAIYRKVRTRLLSTTSNVFFGTVAMAYQWVSGRAVANTSDWMLGDNEADFFGVDAYSHTTGGYLTAHTGYKRWEGAVPNKSKIIVVERGTDVADSAQLDILNTDYAYLKSIGAAGYMYWNVTGDSGEAYPLGTQSKARLKDIAAAEKTGGTNPPPKTYTQAEYDAAVAAATATGINGGQKMAYTDVAVYVSSKLEALG